MNTLPEAFYPKCQFVLYLRDFIANPLMKPTVFDSRNAVSRILTFMSSGTVVFGFLFCLFLFPAAGAQAQEKGAEYTYAEFYNDLAPYGQWIEDPHYGYVWSPGVEGGFRPYFTNGHWAMTQYGNTWISDYIWGWACFHYGRWTFDTYYGWLWVPGQDWGAAWVMWRSGPGFLGWAPLDPGYSFKENQVADAYLPPKDWWVFLPPQYLYKGNYYSYWSGPTGNSSMIKTTSQLNNYYEFRGVNYITGPYAKQVEKVAKKPVQVFKLGSSANLTTKIHQDEIKIFRPLEIKALSVYGNNPSPPGVLSAPHPVSEKPQAINAQLGKAQPGFREELANHTLGTGTQPAVRANVKTAPQSPDPVPYNWKNPEHNQDPASVEYRVAPVMHPDHGPSQQPDSLPKPRDPNPKKLPVRSVQNADPVKPDDIRIRK